MACIGLMVSYNENAGNAEVYKSKQILDAREFVDRFVVKGLSPRSTIFKCELAKPFKGPFVSTPSLILFKMVYKVSDDDKHDVITQADNANFNIILSVIEGEIRKMSLELEKMTESLNSSFK